MIMACGPSIIYPETVYCKQRRLSTLQRLLSRPATIYTFVLSTTQGQTKADMYKIHLIEGSAVGAAKQWPANATMQH